MTAADQPGILDPDDIRNLREAIYDAISVDQLSPPWVFANRYPAAFDADFRIFVRLLDLELELLIERTNQLFSRKRGKGAPPKVEALTRFAEQVASSIESVLGIQLNKERLRVWPSYRTEGEEFYSQETDRDGAAAAADEAPDKQMPQKYPLLATVLVISCAAAARRCQKIKLPLELSRILGPAVDYTMPGEPKRRSSRPKTNRLRSSEVQPSGKIVLDLLPGPRQKR